MSAQKYIASGHVALATSLPLNALPSFDIDIAFICCTLCGPSSCEQAVNGIPTVMTTC
jgi:hypothetical protein